MSDKLQRLKIAAQNLLSVIEVSTDCMSNQIKRENIDDQINVLEAIVETIGEPMPFQVQELRPEVLAFALLMEQRLRDKDADRGQSWKGQSVDNLIVQAQSKAFALDRNYSARTKHAVDIANGCMFIADVSGALEPQAEESVA
jgi:hypothetical protein